MEEKIGIFADKEIGNLEFLNSLKEVYCFKMNIEGQIINYAYITSSCKLLIVCDHSLTNYDTYYWDDCDINCANNSRKKICELLGEIAVRIVMLKGGNPFEKKQAKTLWQIFNPQKRTPKELLTYINKINKR